MRFIHVLGLHFFHQIETEVLKCSKYTKDKILMRILKANLLYLRI